MIKIIYEEFVTQDGEVANITHIRILGIPIYTYERYTENINIVKKFTQEPYKEETENKIGFNYENKSKTS